ncbi:MAG: nucleotidyltransferase substrate binding protein [Ignavibacteriaceae bacterium]|nr:nucleotidyltransferase substrate binding protein [Ignavibacteriaceae bacterium]
MKLIKDHKDKSNPDVVDNAAIIHFFEITFELSWKLLKDYLTDEGFSDINSPREAIKKAFEYGLISDGRVWMNALETRNLTVHTYDESKAEETAENIRTKYFAMFIELYEKLMEKM